MADNTFWHQRQIQPKRKFRWTATVGDGKKLYTYVIKKVVKPEWTAKSNGSLCARYFCRSCRNSR